MAHHREPPRGAPASDRRHREKRKKKEREAGGKIKRKERREGGRKEEKKRKEKDVKIASETYETTPNCLTCTLGPPEGEEGEKGRANLI